MHAPGQQYAAHFSSKLEFSLLEIWPYLVLGNRMFEKSCCWRVCMCMTAFFTPLLNVILQNSIFLVVSQRPYVDLFHFTSSNTMFLMTINNISLQKHLPCSYHYRAQTNRYTLTDLDSSCPGSLLKTTPPLPGYPWVSGGSVCDPRT